MLKNKNKGGTFIFVVLKKFYISCLHSFLVPLKPNSSPKIGTQIQRFPVVITWIGRESQTYSATCEDPDKYSWLLFWIGWRGNGLYIPYYYLGSGFNIFKSFPVPASKIWRLNIFLPLKWDILIYIDAIITRRKG